MIADWFSTRLADATCQVQWMPAGRSAEWRLVDGFMSHLSKGFFTVVGLRWTSPAGGLVERPFLDQQEVGTLGFLMRERDGRPQLLVQAPRSPSTRPLTSSSETSMATDSARHLEVVWRLYALSLRLPLGTWLRAAGRRILSWDKRPVTTSPPLT